jgi:hypothetical protein
MVRPKRLEARKASLRATAPAVSGFCLASAPNHPQTQGKIEHGHQTLTNLILLENCYLPGALEEAIAAFGAHLAHLKRPLSANQAALQR